MLEGAQEVLGVQAVLAAAVRRDGAGTGGVSDERARGRIHGCKSAAAASESPQERIVPACIEDHEIELGAGILEFFQNIVQLECFESQAAFVLEARIDRNEVVAPVGLDAMSCIEHEGRCVILDSPRELDQGRLHAAQIGIGDAHHLEAEGGKLFVDRNGVVHRIVERRFGVGGIPDHQRNTL